MRGAAIDAREDLALDGEGERHDEEHKKSHLGHEEDENLQRGSVTAAHEHLHRPDTHEGVVERHGGGRGRSDCGKLETMQRIGGRCVAKVCEEAECESREEENVGQRGFECVQVGYLYVSPRWAVPSCYVALALHLASGYLVRSQQRHHCGWCGNWSAGFFSICGLTGPDPTLDQVPVELASSAA